MWLKERPLDFFINYFTHSEVPIIVSGPKGEIHWANRAFEEFIGYNTWELTVGPNGKGVTWDKISVNDENLEADKAMILECIKGNIKSYSVKKQYIPKNEKPVWVDLHVVRYPLEGEIECFMVTLVPLKNGTAAAFALAMSTIKEITEKIDTYTSKVPQMEANIVKAIDEKEKSISEIESIFINTARLIKKYPKVSGLVTLVFLVMLLGNQLVEAIQNTKSLIGW